MLYSQRGRYLGWGFFIYIEDSGLFPHFIYNTFVIGGPFLRFGLLFTVCGACYLRLTNCLFVAPIAFLWWVGVFSLCCVRFLDPVDAIPRCGLMFYLIILPLSPLPFLSGHLVAAPPYDRVWGFSHGMWRISIMGNAQ